MPTEVGGSGESVNSPEADSGLGSPWRRLDLHIVAVWRMRTLLAAAVVLALVGPFTFLAGSAHRIGSAVGTAALGLVLLTMAIAVLRLLTVGWRYRTTRWRLEPAFVQIESGWWRTVTERVPIDRVHTIVVGQGPFLRRHDLFETTLHASGGSGLLVLAGLTANDVADVRRHLGFER